MIPTPRRTVVGRALGAVVLLTAVVGGVVALTFAREDAEARAGWSRKAFPHRPHLTPEVVSAALREGLAADRGEARPGGGGVVDKVCYECHDFAAKGPEHHLQRADACDKCHIGDEHLEIKYAAAPSDGRPAFPHAEHLQDPSITCFTCHRIGTDEHFIEFSVPEDGLGLRGTQGRPGGKFGDSTCSDCHANHEAAEGRRDVGLVRQDEITGDGRQCAECHLSNTEILPQKFRSGSAAVVAAAGRRPFLHADHGGDSSDCESCHEQVSRSGTIWDYDPVADTAAACKACHVDASGNTLAVPGATEVVPKVAFSLFPHDQHLEVDGSVETSFKGTPGCIDCHYQDRYRSELVPGPSQEPVSRAELIDYADCVDCHDTWRTDPHPPGACFKCHDMGQSLTADGMQPMLEVEVTRDALFETTFTTHHHPGITTKGMGLLEDAREPSGQSCKDCHLGEIEELESKLTGKRFDHDPHVSDAPTNQECLACHTTVATTKRSNDLARFEPHLAGLPTPTGVGALAKACVECHIGGAPDDLDIRRVVRTVPEFDHATHVAGFDWKGGRGISCAECHQPGGETGYQTPADVLDCTQCHSHDTDQPEKLARTGPIGSTEGTGSCNDCHSEIGEHGEDLSAPDDVAARTRRKLILSAGEQHHDLSGECQVCHHRELAEGQAPWTYEPRISATTITGVSVHDVQPDAWFNDPSIRGGPQERSCRTCHYNEPDGFLRR